MKFHEESLLNNAPKKDQSKFENGSLVLPEAMTSQLVNEKYSVMRGLPLQEKKEYFQALQESFNRLPYDQFMNEEHMKEGKTFRVRRYGRYALAPMTEGGSLSLLPHAPYVPGPYDHNQYQGGKPRLFPPLEEVIAHNPLLAELIHSFASRLPEPLSRMPLEIKVQQIRITAPGLPTPDGKHKDGETYVAVIIMSRENVTGGEVQIYNKSGEQMIQSFTPLATDAYIIDDQEVMHYVVPLGEPVDSTKPGNRDIFILNFNPLSKITAINTESKSFDFLGNEPDLYSKDDIKK